LASSIFCGVGFDGFDTVMTKVSTNSLSFSQAATNELRFGDELDSGIVLYAITQSWSKKEQARRLLHATSLLVHASKYIRLRAEEIAKRAIKKLD
jgi:hypothetical protein